MMRRPGGQAARRPGFALLLFSVLAAAPSLTVAQVQPQAGDGVAVVNRASQVYRGLSSLRADFEQVISDEMIGTFESRGVLIQAGQNQLSMRFSDPKGDAIVIDGRHVWAYTPSTTPGQVIRLPVPNGPTYGFNVLGWLLDRPAERYRINYLGREFVDFAQTDVVQLTPISSDLPFKRAVLWLDRDSALPRKLEIHEKSGGTRMLTLTKLRTNEKVSDRTFRFDVPDGVRVIDQEV